MPSKDVIESAAHLVKVAQSARRVAAARKQAADNWLDALKSQLSSEKIKSLMASNPELLPTLLGAVAGGGIGLTAGGLLGRKRRWHENLRDALAGGLAGAGLGAGVGYAGHKFLQPSPGGSAAADAGNAPADLATQNTYRSALRGGLTGGVTVGLPLARRMALAEPVTSANLGHLEQGLQKLISSEMLSDADKETYRTIAALLREDRPLSQTLALKAREAAGTAAVDQPLKVWRTPQSTWSLEDTGQAPALQITPKHLASITESAQGLLEGERVQPGSLEGRPPRFLGTAGYESVSHPTGPFGQGPPKTTYRPDRSLLGPFRRGLSQSRQLAHPRVQGGLTASRFLSPFVVGGGNWLWNEYRKQQLGKQLASQPPQAAAN